MVDGDNFMSRLGRDARAGDTLRKNLEALRAAGPNGGQRMKIKLQCREEQEVSFLRWVEYHLGIWLECAAHRLARPFHRLARIGDRVKWHALDREDEVLESSCEQERLR
jgi:hypothetical protein